MEVFAKKPARVQAHRLPHNYDMATHEFCEANFLLCRYNPDGTVSIRITYAGGDTRVLTGTPGDWIVIDNGPHLLDPAVFEHRYVIPQDIAA